MQAGFGASVVNIEEHVLPGARDLVINHTDQPAPVVKAIVDYLSALTVNHEWNEKIEKTPGVTVTIENEIIIVKSGNRIIYEGPTENIENTRVALQEALNSAQ